MATKRCALKIEWKKANRNEDPLTAIPEQK